MASSHKRRMIAFNAGGWAFALGLAGALEYALNDSFRTRGGADLGAPAESDTCAVQTAPRVVIGPPIAIIGSRPAGAKSAKSSEPLSDIGQ
jgi:hypothetical protein